jgi:hypothetical protein
MSRECPHPDCDRSIPAEMYACKQHWFSLPSGIRNRIWRAYRAWNRDLSDASVAALRAAQGEAEKHWREKPEPVA